MFIHESAWSARPFFALWFGVWNFRLEFIWIGRCERKLAWWMKKGCTGLLRSSAGLGGPADPLVGLLGPVLGMLLRAGLSMLCVMLGERSQVSFLVVLLRDLPHTYSCTCFYSTKQRWKQARTLSVVNTGESKLLLNKYLKKPKFLFLLFFLFILFYCFMFFMAN